MDGTNGRRVSKSVAFKLSQEAVLAGAQASKNASQDARKSVAANIGKVKSSGSQQGKLNESQKGLQTKMRRRESSERKTPKKVPPLEKEYQLSNVLRSSLRCLSQMREVKDHMGRLIAKDEHISLGLKRLPDSPDLEQLAQLSRKITILSREAFLPAHRLNQTAICLHNTEDILRSPGSSHMYDFSDNGRMKIPAITFNSITVSKIQTCVDHATEFYNKFNCKGPVAEQMQEILLLVMRAFQDLHLTAIGCYEIFKLLLYFSGEDKQSLQDFIQSLPSVERVEMLVEVQDLRRTIDEIVIFLEKLSWGSYTVFCLASGKNVDEEPSDGSLPNPFEYSETELLPSGSFYQQMLPRKVPAYKSEATKSWIQQNSTGENKGDRAKAEASYAAMANDRIHYHHKNSGKNQTQTKDK